MMDFKSLISNSSQYTFHSHTEYCDGHADMMSMARAAVAAGFLYYGFTPHSPIPLDSPCNMSAESVPAYLAQYKAISSDPSLSSCRFFAGMEVDYLGDQWGPSNEYFRSLPLDYIIGSVHFVPTTDGQYVDTDGAFENFKYRMENFFRRDIEYVVDTFYRQSEAMIEAGGFDILGHFDKIGLNASCYHPGIEDSSFYRAYIDRMLGLIIDRDLTVELNTKAYERHGRFFPSPYALSALLDAGITVVVNSDAHTTEGINASRAEGMQLIAKLSRR